MCYVAPMRHDMARLVEYLKTFDRRYADRSGDTTTPAGPSRLHPIPGTSRRGPRFLAVWQ